MKSINVQRQGTGIIIDNFAGFTVGNNYPYAANPTAALLERLVTMRNTKLHNTEALRAVVEKAAQAVGGLGVAVAAATKATKSFSMGYKVRETE